KLIDLAVVSRKPWASLKQPFEITDALHRVSRTRNCGEHEYLGIKNGDTRREIFGGTNRFYGFGPRRGVCNQSPPYLRFWAATNGSESAILPHRATAYVHQLCFRRASRRRSSRL